jgi:hypothetical protein
VLTAPSGTSGRFRATDVYEWLAGGFFLIHRWHAQLPDGDSKGIEIIGYDTASGRYRMHSFDHQGNVGVMIASLDGDTWTFSSETVRFTGGFRDGKTFAGLWERRSNGAAEWSPWMKVELTRIGEVGCGYY